MLDAVIPLVWPAPSRLDLAVAPLAGMVSVAAYRGRVPALATALGFAPPATPLRITVGDETWAWSGMESWLVTGAAGLAQRLQRIGDHAAVVDQSHGRVVLHATGPAASAALARLVPIDLDPRSFGEDATAITLAGAIGVQIWRVADGFALACYASFAQALAEALAKAAAYV